MRLLRVLVVIGILVVALLKPVPALAELPASHNGWSHCGSITPSARQTTGHFYEGLAGKMYTYQPAVSDIAHQFSLSHLFVFTNGRDSLVELGWFRGQGMDGNVSASTYYNAFQDPLKPYVEVNYGAAPNATYVNYKVELDHRDVGSGLFVWKTYTTTSGAWQYMDEWWSADLSLAIMESGAEIAAEYPASYHGLQMAARVVPSHQIRLNGWNTWDDAFMAQQGDTTYICNDSPYVLQYNWRFDDYVISGTLP